MMVLIIGGSGSGKSAYAEEYIERIAGKGNKYYYLQRCRFLTRKERKRSQGIKDFEKIKAF